MIPTLLGSGILAFFLFSKVSSLVQQNSTTMKKKIFECVYYNKIIN